MDYLQRIEQAAAKRPPESTSLFKQIIKELQENIQKEPKNDLLHYALGILRF